MAIGKRPDRKNYAMYDARGAAKYKKDLAAYLKKKAEAERTKNKLSTEKNIKKQKTANKKATTTTKTTKGKTSAKPTSTAAKGKSLATGKTTSKTKAVETPKTKTATKTRTRTRTQTKSKTTTKTTPESKVTPKTTPKTTTKSKTTGKTTPKRKPFDPQKRGRGRPVGSKNAPKRKPFDSVNSKNKPKGNQTLQIKEVAKQTKELAGKTVDKTKEGVKNFKNKANKFFDPAKPNAPATTRAQKFFSKAGKKLGKGLSTAKNYTKTQVLPKLGRDALKILKNNPASTLKSAGKAGIGVVGQLAVDQLGDRAFRALRGENKKSLKQFREERDKEMGKRGLMRLRPKNIGKTINSLRGKGNNTSTQSSTTKNINKQKTSNNNKLKVSNVSQRDKDLREAKRRVRKAKGYNKEKLQREVRYLEKFGKQGRTWSNPVGAQGNNKPSSVKTDTSTKSPRPGSARAKMRAKNEARFGKAHVDKLRAKNRDFQAMKKKKMTKAEFIRRYPNSQTAKRARGL